MIRKLFGLAVVYAVPTLLAAQSPQIPNEHASDQGKAMVATHYEGRPIAPEHGGPARLLVPHLYFWKSAKWLKGLRFTARNEAGFWELRGYHLYGDPWREQRYTNDP